MKADASACKNLDQAECHKTHQKNHKNHKNLQMVKYKLIHSNRADNPIHIPMFISNKI